MEQLIATLKVKIRNHPLRYDVYYFSSKLQSLLDHAPVTEPHAIVDVRTMMVKLSHTPVANSAVLSPERPHHPARVAESQDVGATIALPLVVICNLLDRPVIFVSIFGQKPRVLLVGHQKTDPHDNVHNDEGVMGLWQAVPGDWDAPQKVHWIGPQKDATDEEQEGSFSAPRLPKDQCPAKAFVFIGPHLLCARSDLTKYRGKRARKCSGASSLLPRI